MLNNNFFNSPLKIGPLAVQNRVFLAPLAGITDIPMRRICTSMGASLTFCEMISAVALNYANKKTLEMAKRHPAEIILGAQLEGGNPEEIAKAIGTFSTLNLDIIDINMGCPVKKVVNAGGGSGLLRYPDLISEILLGARKATKKPLSLKYRLGFTREQITVEDTTRRAIEAGFDMVTIHGRTRSEGYNVSVDLLGIKKGVDFAKNINPNLIVVGNGNLFSFADANTMFETTNCDAVMISRGALGNPWIFKEILLGEKITVTLSEWAQVVKQHLTYTIEEFGDTYFATISMRKHLLWYASGFPNCKSLRLKICSLNSMADMFQAIDDFTETLDPTLERIVAKQITAF